MRVTLKDGYYHGYGVLILTDAEINMKVILKMVIITDTVFNNFS